MSVSSALNPHLCALLPNSPIKPIKLSPPKTSLRFKFKPKLHVALSSFKLEEEEDHVIGDCVVFEEGVFDDPFLEQPDPISYDPEKPKKPRRAAEIAAENLVPEEWKEAQAAVNITKKERRKIAQEMEFGTRVEKKKKGLMPIRDLDLEEYKAYREAKSNQLRPLALEKPESFKEEENDKHLNNVVVSERVAPKNPRWAV